MSRKKILLIPDAYLGDFSGAYVAQVAKKLLLKLGHEVAIFSDETTVLVIEKNGTIVYPRFKFSTLSYWQEGKYVRNYKEVLDNFKPDIVFTLGSVTNKPICYWRIARERGIKTISKIFMQDFFCTNFYANDKNGLCTRCLNKGPYEVFKGKCKPFKGNKISNMLRMTVAAELRKKLRRELVKVNAVITSSMQQVDFYVKYGIPRCRCYQTPLYFNGEKLLDYMPERGNYYVFVAQNRIDKGIHLLKDVLAACNDDVKVVAAYTTQRKIDEAIDKYGLRDYVDKGLLEMRSNCTWKTNLGDVIAKSRGVVNPSIWPTTTEYVLLETLGLKKPIFTFNVGIHAEILVSDKNGFVAKTPQQMGQQMNAFLHNDALYDTISQNAYELYKKMTDYGQWEKTLNEIIVNIT